MTFTVGEPFDSDPGADVVLLSCDNFAFLTRKDILRLASPVFNDMFSLPQLKAEVENNSSDSLNETNLPSVELSETGLVLDIILRFCYPLPSPTGVDDFETALAVRVAADKYDMVFILSKLDDSIKAAYPKNLSYSLLLYRFACDKEQEVQARLYALDCLRLSCTSLVRHWPSSTLDMALINLIDYHQAVTRAVVNTISSRRFIESSGCKDLFRSNCSSCFFWDGRSSQPKWWKDNIASCLRRINSNGPILGHVLNSGKDIGVMLCNECASQAFRNWVTIEEKMSKFIEDETKKVCFS